MQTEMWIFGFTMAVGLVYCLGIAFAIAGTIGLAALAAFYGFKAFHLVNEYRGLDTVSVTRRILV